MAFDQRSYQETVFGMSTVEEITRLDDWNYTATHVHLLVHLAGDDGVTEIAIPRSLLVDLAEPLRGEGT